MDKNELKVQALTEKIGQVVSNYENQIADIRAEITLEYARRDETERALRDRVAELEVSYDLVEEDDRVDRDPFYD